MRLAYPLLSEFGMAPLLISGIASVASSAIDAWSNAAQRRVGVEQAKFANAIDKAMGLAPATSLSQAAPTAQSLETQLRNSPEIRGILDTQDPTRPASLSVTGEGRVFLQVPGNQPAELAVSLETRDLARQLSLARSSATLNSASSASLNRFSTSPAGTLAAHGR